MTSDEIKIKRLAIQEEEHSERNKILDPHYSKYHKMEKDLEAECELIGHFFQKAYYNWGSFDERQFTHETFNCKYCRKRIHLHYSEVDNINNHLK